MQETQPFTETTKFLFRITRKNLFLLRQATPKQKTLHIFDRFASSFCQGRMQGGGGGEAPTTQLISYILCAASATKLFLALFLAVRRVHLFGWLYEFILDPPSK